MQLSMDTNELRTILEPIVAEAVRQIAGQLAPAAPLAEPLLYTRQEAAEQCRVSVSTIDIAVRDRELKPTKFGTAVRFAPDDLRDWINKNKASGA